MTSQQLQSPSGFAILALAEIKSATDAFDRGESNVFDALDVIVAVVEAYRATSLPEVRRDAA